MKQKPRGVSLLETILAAAILSGAVVAVTGLSARSIRSVRLNQEYEKAWDYMNRQLTLIDEAGADVLMQSGQLTGMFESADGRQWKWTAQIAETEISNLYSVIVRMEWPSANRILHIDCQTRLCGRGYEAQQETPVSQEPQS